MDLVEVSSPLPSRVGSPVCPVAVEVGLIPQRVRTSRLGERIWGRRLRLQHPRVIPWTALAERVTFGGAIRLLCA